MKKNEPKALTALGPAVLPYADLRTERPFAVCRPFLLTAVTGFLAALEGCLRPEAMDDCLDGLVARAGGFACLCSMVIASETAAFALSNSPCTRSSALE